MSRLREFFVCPRTVMWAIDVFGHFCVFPDRVQVYDSGFTVIFEVLLIVDIVKPVRMAILLLFGLCLDEIHFIFFAYE